jgi:hypothetical protein
VDFGTPQPGTPVTKTFTIKNMGTADLVLDGAIAIPSGFTAAPSAFSSLTLAPGTSTTFDVTLTASTVGTYSGQVSFISNTGGVSGTVYPFNVTGKVSTVQIIDDGDVRYAQSGAWTTYAAGYQGDLRYTLPGDGSTSATWTFTVPVTGLYRVYATWITHSNRATNAPYTVTAQGTGTTVAVNQQLSPVGIIDQGASWQSLGDYSVTGSSLVVQLSNAANGQVIADAIRIERLEPLQASGDAPAGQAVQRLTQEALAPVVAEAMARWEATGLKAAEARLLEQTTFTVGNLGGSFLGLASADSRSVRLDDDAAGFGWFIDATPGIDEEFALRTASTSSGAQAGSPAAGKIDLLTAVMHEMGHVLGRDDLASELAQGNVMSDRLSTGTRRAPQENVVQARDALFALVADGEQSATREKRQSNSWWLLAGQE